MTTPPKQAPRVWVRRVYSPILAAVVPAAVLAAWLRPRRASDRKPAQVIVGAAIAVSLGSLRVVIDSDGLRVGFGPWGWPERRFPTHRIGHATVERGSHTDAEVGENLRRGLIRLLVGLGYRIVPTGTRVALGFGDVLVLHLTNGRTFGVTVPDAQRAADLLNAMTATSAGSP